jgi:hypothetical protein
MDEGLSIDFWTYVVVDKWMKVLSIDFWTYVVDNG